MRLKLLKNYLISYAEINLKWSRDLITGDKIIKFSEKNAGENLNDFRFSSDLLEITSKVQLSKNMSYCISFRLNFFILKKHH